MHSRNSLDITIKQQGTKRANSGYLYSLSCFYLSNLLIMTSLIVYCDGMYYVYKYTCMFAFEHVLDFALVLFLLISMVVMYMSNSVSDVYRTAWWICFCFNLTDLHFKYGLAASIIL